MTRLKSHLTAFLTGLLLCAAMVTGAHTAMAQGQLAPAVTVNDRVVTGYELSQRTRLLDLFNTAGDVGSIAREQLIDDRLKEQEMARFGWTLSEAELQQALSEFASRGNLSVVQFERLLAQNGIAFDTFVSYVKIGATWRDFVRARFNSTVTVTAADVDRAIARLGTAPTQLEVLLSEIIIPAPPELAARVNEVANRISRLRSYDEFSEAARQVSALPSREDGGRLGWLPIDNYPPQLRQVLLDLRPGEVTEPIQLDGAVALFQKRGQREGQRGSQAPSSLEYAAYYIPGGTSAAAQRTAAELKTRVDTCDDLYGVARNQPPEVLDRLTLPPSDIPGDIALELARLDAGEVSYNLTRNNGQTLVFLMLCARNGAGAASVDPDRVRDQIRSQRLSALSEALLEDLRSSAVIRP
ncbi:MAG: peptidylprolyl isomerase [Yoonia sp.]|uniref:peptidylprolyl isomerase n=1 Tax=Yoonia sp. TaxID=2212373 RepID=UPI003EF7CFC4